MKQKLPMWVMMLAATALTAGTGILLDVSGLGLASRVPYGAATALVIHLFVATKMIVRLMDPWVITRRRVSLSAAKGWFVAAAMSVLTVFLEGMLLPHPFEQLAIGASGTLATSVVLIPWWRRRARKVALESEAYLYGGRAAKAAGIGELGIKVPVKYWLQLRSSGVSPEVAGKLLADHRTVDQIVAMGADIPPSLAGGVL